MGTEQTTVLIFREHERQGTLCLGLVLGALILTIIRDTHWASRGVIYFSQPSRCFLAEQMEAHEGGGTCAGFLWPQTA